MDEFITNFGAILYSIGQVSLDISIFIFNVFISVSVIVLQHLFFVLIGVITFIVTVIIHKKELGPIPLMKLESNEYILNKTKEKLHAYKFPPRKLMKHSCLVSRNVDDVIDELITLLLRDYISSWYEKLVKEHGSFVNDLKPLIRNMLFTFRDMCQNIDAVKLITCDFVNIINKHLQQLKCAAINPPPDKVQQAFKIQEFLSTEEEEKDALRKITEYLIITLMPSNYAKYKPIRYLLREIFAITVFFKLIEKWTDPDTINLKLIMYLKNQQKAAEKQRRLYAYTETYEDFIKLIQECGSIEALQRMRYNIASEITVATIQRDLKKSKGLDVDKEFNTQKTNKGDLLQARNLPQYLNQLRYAKGQVEKRIKLLGGTDYNTSRSGSVDSIHEDKIPTTSQKVLSMSVIMQSSFCRRHFSKFLQKEELHSLLAFWEAVGEMKLADKAMWHQLGNEIARMYIHNQASGVRLHKKTLKGIEEFMMANKGPDAFFQAQDEVYKRLEENSYASFVVSDIYNRMLYEAEKEGIDFMHKLRDSGSHSDSPNTSASLNKSEEMDISLFDHSSYARTQLKTLQEKLNHKLQAISALRSNPKCDKKVVLKLDKEIEDLYSERRMLENHIEKTELWIRYLGLWQSTVVQASVAKEKDKNVPYFNIMVHLSNEAGYQCSQSVGWVVVRNLNSFHSLHQKLVPAAVWLKKIDLPTKPIFKSLDKSYLEKVKSSLQTFLSAVTKDDGLNKSEALYSFLSPSPEHMKYPACPPKKPFKFNILQFFKGVQILGQGDDENEEELLFLDDTDSKEDRKDSIAEPLYALIGELFEQKGVFNWLRKSIITFVQIAYGRTINKQIRESVAWIVSEPMLLSYLQLFRDTMWPTGQAAKPEPQPERTKKEKMETKYTAKEMLLKSIPDLLNTLFGHQNARKGVSKIFDALQEKTINKHLLYSLLFAFLCECTPDLKRSSSPDIY